MAKFITLGAAAIVSLSAATFFPLEQGNTWTYRNNASGQAFTVRVGAPAVINKQTYYTLQGYVDSDVMVRINERNVLVYLDGEVEKPLVSFVPTEGTWLPAPFRTCAQESQTQEKRGTYNGPAGEFKDVLEVQFRSNCADAGTLVEQFAENIGMVRRVEQSFAGPRQYDLVSARIGSMLINALPTGTFAVTVDQVNGSDQLTAILRLRLNGMPLKVVFASGQQYEVVLRDEAGNVLWKWSDGRFFDQALHEVTLTSDWTAAVLIPRPASTPEPKTYIVQAWLTTLSPSPSFSATVPVTIGAPRVLGQVRKIASHR